MIDETVLNVDDLIEAVAKLPKYPNSEQYVTPIELLHKRVQRRMRRELRRLAGRMVR